MRQVPGREPDGFAPRFFYAGIFVPVLLCCAGLFVLVFVPQSFYDQAPDVPGP